MSLHLFTGLPGSGKSSRLIELVNSAIARHQPVSTFACSESPVLAEREEFRVHRVLACRRPDLVCPLHYFVSTLEASVILSCIPPGTLAAFDEAQSFDPGIVKHWTEASQRGVEVLVSIPSDLQLGLLEGSEFTATVFKVQCQKCGNTEASTFAVLPETNGAMSLCGQCRDEMVVIARRDLLDRLERQPPHPGEKAIYQPIDELPECASWKIVRPDSKTRVDLMSRLISEMGLPKSVAPSPATYLDVFSNRASWIF
jgi:thymidine kinase